MSMASSANPVSVAAALIVGIESLALLFLTGFQIVGIISGDAALPVSAVALSVLTLVGAFALGAFAVAILRGRSWGRSGAIVFQVLFIAIAAAALTGAYMEPGAALLLGVPALAAFVLLIMAARRGVKAEIEQEDGGREV